jgi:hypothetical protein
VFPRLFLPALLAIPPRQAQTTKSDCLKSLHAQRRVAFDPETSRDKARDCPDANSTRAREICLQSKLEKTQANYAAFSGAIRALLALPAPATPGQQPYSGPAANGAFNQDKGSSLAPVVEGQAELRLLRLHMEELGFIYGSR